MLMMEKCNIEINNKIYNSFKVEVRQINVVPQEKFKEEKIKKIIKPSSNHPWKVFRKKQ